MNSKRTNNIVYAGLTDTGKQRSNNEDRWVCCHIWDDKNLIAAVIDGVGGYEGGEIAADIAAKELVNYLKLYPDGERAQLLKEAIVSANNHIYEERKINLQYSNMGCVMSAILVEQEKGYIHLGHIGDTRFYEYSENTLTKLSHDQSPIGRYEELGLLTEKEAMEHPMRNVIERDLGQRQLDNTINDYIETATFPLKPNASWLLCSDGLTDMLTTAQITAILANKEPPNIQVRQLINAANNAGGKDNITVVILHNNTPTEQSTLKQTSPTSNENLITKKEEQPNVEEKSVHLSQQKKSMQWTKGILLGMSGLLLLAGGGIGYTYYLKSRKDKLMI